MRILLTGAAGFIGARIHNQLTARGRDVVAVDDMLPAAHGPNVPLPEGVQRIDASSFYRCRPFHRCGRGRRCCDGPTVDLGCGPGRLVTALLHRGVAALGIDISPLAITVTRQRGAPALRRDLFDALPGDGRWRYALLADGNIGIGGNPHQLLARSPTLVTCTCDRSTDIHGR